jgi:hypothetical protein
MENGWGGDGHLGNGRVLPDRTQVAGLADSGVVVTIPGEDLRVQITQGVQSAQGIEIASEVFSPVPSSDKSEITIDYVNFHINKTSENRYFTK